MDEKLKIQVEKIVKEVMEIDISKFESNKQINTIEQWDSFNNLMLVSSFEEAFNIEFTANEVEEVQTIENLYSIIEIKCSNL